MTGAWSKVFAMEGKQGNSKTGSHKLCAFPFFFMSHIECETLADEEYWRMPSKLGFYKHKHYFLGKNIVVTIQVRAHLFFRPNCVSLELILPKQATNYEIVVYWAREAILASIYCGFMHFMDLIWWGERLLEVHYAFLLFSCHLYLVAHLLASMTCSKGSSCGVGTKYNPQLTSLKTSLTS